MLAAQHITMAMKFWYEEVLSSGSSIPTWMGFVTATVILHHVDLPTRQIIAGEHNMQQHAIAEFTLSQIADR